MYSMTMNTLEFRNAILNIMNSVRFQKPAVFEGFLDGDFVAVKTDGYTVSVHKTLQDPTQGPGLFALDEPYRSVEVTEAMTKEDVMRALMPPPPPKARTRVRSRTRSA